MRASEARSMSWYFWTRQAAADARFDLIQPTTLNHWLIAAFLETKSFAKFFKLLLWRFVYIYSSFQSSSRIYMLIHMFKLLNSRWVMPAHYGLQFKETFTFLITTLPSVYFLWVYPKQYAHSSKDCVNIKPDLLQSNCKNLHIKHSKAPAKAEGVHSVILVHSFNDASSYVTFCGASSSPSSNLNKSLYIYSAL